jgi:Tfp pilus assembly PilM family ATPase
MKSGIKDSLHFEASSPDELTEGLAQVSQNGAKRNRLAALHIYGQDILFCQFSLPKLSTRELKNSLNLEAVGLLSLQPDEVELDYRVFSSSAGNVAAYLWRCPKRFYRST